MAEVEHKLYADVNNSKNMDKVLPDGTSPPFLTQGHILKHGELLENDIEIEKEERSRLLAHIVKDIENLKQIQVSQPTPNLSALNPAALQNLGGIGGVNPSQQVVPPPEKQIPIL